LDWAKENFSLKQIARSYHFEQADWFNMVVNTSKNTNLFLSNHQFILKFPSAWKVLGDVQTGIYLGLVKDAVALFDTNGNIILFE